MTLKEGFEIYLQINERYRSWLNVFLNYIQAAGLDPAAIDLDQISLKDLYRYLTWLRGAGYSRGSMRTYQTALKCMLNYLQQYGFMDPDQLDLRCYNLIDAAPPDREILAVSDVDRIDGCLNLSSVRDLRDWCIFHLMLDLGLTTLQISVLSKDSVDLENGLIWSRPLSPELVENLMVYDWKVSGRRFCDRFLVNRSGYPLTYDVIKKIFQRLQDLSGVQRLTPSLVLESCGSVKVG